MKIAIAGTGYVGFVTAVCLAEKGHCVICVDADKAKIDQLNKSGRALIYEDGLNELMKKNSSRLSYTTDYCSAYHMADVIFISVGTPEKKDGSADLKYVFQVTYQIAKSLEKDCVIVVKSTVPVGTNEKIEQILSDNKQENIKTWVVSNPEFLSQGTAVRDTLQASRIVIGTEDKTAEIIMRQVYRNFDVPILTTNRRSAEMIKYASNDFLALKISYVNEIANLCEKIGADIDEVTKGMGYDERIGNKFLHAGVGYGGSCFPKDTKALQRISCFYDHELKTIKAAIEVNASQKYKLIKKAKQYYQSFNGLSIAVLGLTFKPGTDDLREAASLVIIPILLEDGARIKVYDPIGIDNFCRKFGKQVTYCKSIREALQDVDLCFILTEWPEIKACTAKEFAELMRSPIIIDGRNCYPLDKMHYGKIVYESIGRKTVGTEGGFDHNI